MTDRLESISKVYCAKRTDGNKIHELVEEVDWNQGLVICRCMWCKEIFK